MAAVDPVFFLIFGICALLLLGITATVVVFVLRYHRSRAPVPTSSVDGNPWLEVAWTLLPTVLVTAMFYYGWAGYLALRNVPKGALEVTATARQWSWRFTYPNGKGSPKLYVPAGKPVRVELVSEDVIHGFYIPAFRVKRDIVPGMKGHAWFTAPRPGSYDLFCSQFCGTSHSAMITTVEALPEGEFAAWLAVREEEALPGEELLKRHGCLGCHSLDGSRGAAPTFKGLFGERVSVVRKGRKESVTADEAFLRESIVDPGATVAEGFEPVMPAYATLPVREIDALVASVKGAK
jgi:cytochrome c oxidase subunit 2